MYVDGGEPDEKLGAVTFLDVGQGLAVLLEYDGRYGLYDAGPDSAGFVDSLRNRGIDSLDWVLLSHNHRDHYGGMLELLAGSATGGLQGGTATDISRKVPAVHVARLMVGPDTAGGFLVDSVLRAARRLDIPIDTVGRGDEFSLGAMSFKILWPAKFLRVGENGASLVVSGCFRAASFGRGDAVVSGGAVGGVAGSFLLTGDLDSLGETRLLEMGADVSAELLQVGHHGSAHSSTLKFLNSVSPHYAVISVGEDNGYGHPAESVLRKLQYVMGAADFKSAFRTDRDGSVTFQLVPGVGIVR